MFFSPCCLLAAALAASPCALAAQAPSDNQPAAVIERLFVAMRASDTAATRAAFVGNARVIPIAPNAPAKPSGQGLSVDQFVAFVGRNAPGSWNERMWSPAQRITGPLADVWFEYDIYHGSTLDHCGVNSVLLQQTSDGWKIVTMAFTSVTTDCIKHPPPA